MTALCPVWPPINQLHIFSPPVTTTQSGMDIAMYSKNLILFCSVVRMGSWQVEKTLYKHSAGVTALALHPSGKLAFSAGKDKKMITWNLVKARPAFISNIKGIAEMIVVSPDGTRYAVGLHRRIDIYSIETAGVEYSIDLKVNTTTGCY